jgi:hypothetical protein
MIVDSSFFVMKGLDEIQFLPKYLTELGQEQQSGTILEDFTLK